MYRIIILIQVKILREGSEVNKAIGQPEQLELVCVPNGNQASGNRNVRNGPPGSGGHGGSSGGGGNQGGGGFRGGNPPQQQGYRPGT